MRTAAFTVALALFATPSLAVQPDEVLKDVGQETKARELSAELRCLVCQNQSIDDSDAPLARDIRVLIRERLTKGDEPNVIREFLISRYGDFILLKPPLKLSTLLLWTTPLWALAAGAIMLVRGARRRASATAPLSADEEARLQRIERGAE